MIFSHLSLQSKAVPLQYQEYEYGLFDVLLCVCVFFLKSAWFFAGGFQLNRKTSPCIFFAGLLFIVVK